MVGVGVLDPFMQPTYSAEGAGSGEPSSQSLIGRWRVRTAEYYYSDYCSGNVLQCVSNVLLTASAK